MIRLGERFYEERVAKGLSLEDVSKATKIRLSFLSALEKGDYKKLPSPTYAYGFVRNYAKFLGLSDKELLALFKREYDEEKTYKVLPEGLVRNEDFPLKRLKLAQTFKIIVAVFVALILYILFQYRFAIFNPPLEISEPKEGQVISGKTVAVTGQTNSNSTVYVNEEIVLVDKNGKFKKNINIFPGEVIITIKAVNNFGKTTIVERNIEAKFPLE